MIRAVAKAAAKRGWEAVGVGGGCDGLLDPPRSIPPDSDMSLGARNLGICLGD